MSLDVTLTSKNKEDVHCFVCEHTHKEYKELYSRNITHNLSKMAKEVDLYSALWHPEDLDIKAAEELIPYLEQGLARLINKPEYYKAFNSPNGWGIYDNFVPFVRDYLGACKEYPDAKVSVSI